MSPRFAAAGLSAAAVCSAVVMWAGVNEQNISLTAWSAAAFALFALIAGWLMNRSSQGGGLAALRENGQLSAIVYAWGAAAMAAMYKLTDLYWQHGLQYAAGMLLFAGVIFSWTLLARPGGPMATQGWPQRAARLNLVHGAVAAVALAVFLFSGKLWAGKADWAANIVFAAGGVSIVALCVFAALRHAKALTES
jgi:hypothetical protein